LFIANADDVLAAAVFAAAAALPLSEARRRSDAVLSC
jgi:hypothetical protein